MKKLRIIVRDTGEDWLELGKPVEFTIRHQAAQYCHDKNIAFGLAGVGCEANLSYKEVDNAYD